MWNSLITLMPLGMAFTTWAMPDTNEVADDVTRSLSASSLLNKAITALGGSQALTTLKGVQWDA